MKTLATVLILLSVIVSTTHTINAQAPGLINFQAQLEGTETTTASVTFTIFDAASGGNQEWTETYPSLAIQNGRIQVLLGSNQSLPADLFASNGDRYLAITVNGETLSPRTRLTSVAYALRAAVADRVLGGGDGGGVTSLNTLTGAVTLEEGSNITITPSGQNLRIDAAGGDGSAGVTSLNSLTGAVTLQQGSNITITTDGQNLRFDAAGETGGGGNFTSITGGTGISVSDTDGPTSEISITPNSITDTQIADNSIGASSLGAGSVGSSELQSSIVLGTSGRLDIQNSSGQTRGTFTTNNNGGFLGLDSSDGDDGVTLEVLNGNAFGRITVHSLSGDPGIRLAGDQTGTDSHSGQSLFGGSIALFKRDGTNSGVWSRIVGTNASTSWGVVGVSNALNNEVIRLDGQSGNLTVGGNASIAGNLSKGGGSFKIDHPLDPENKYLSHSFVESPDMMNVYNGNVELNENGEAWVDLPEWFEALNRDFRYQLTCIGGFAQVYIADKIADNRFRIAGGTPGLEVSWQVTGIRHDPYAEKHRIQVEEEKQANQRGRYLHPDVY